MQKSSRAPRGSEPVAVPPIVRRPGRRTIVDGVKLIALINSRSDAQAPYRSLTVEAGDYDAAHGKVLEALTEDDRLLSVRVDRSEGQ